MSTTNIPIKITFQGEDNGINEVFGSINLSIRNLKGALNGVDSSVKTVGSDSKNSSNGVNKLGESLDKVKKEATGAGNELSALSKIAKKISQDTGINSLNIMASQLSGFSSAMRSSAMSTIDNLSNIEDNTIRIQGLIAPGDKETFLTKFNDQLDDLSTKTRASKSELSDLWYRIASSGVKRVDSIQSLTNAASLISDASKRDLNTSDAFSILNAMRNSFQYKIADIPKLTDQIVRGKDLGSFNYHELEESIKYVTPVLGALTNAKGDVNMALLSTLGNHEIKGSVAGTSLRKLILNLIPNVDPKMLGIDKGKFEDVLGMSIKDAGSNSTLAKLGITPEQIYTQRAVLDKNGDPAKDEKGNIKTEKVIDLEKALKLLSEKIGGLNEDDQLSVLKKIYGTTAVPAGLTLKKFLDDFKDNLNEIRNPNNKGFALSQANASRNTLGAKIDELSNSITNAKVGVLNGETNSILKSIIDNLIQFSNWVGKSGDGTKNFVGIVGTVTYGFTSLMSSMGNFLLTLYLLPKVFLEIKPTFIRFFGFLGSIFSRIWRFIPELGSFLGIGRIFTWIFKAIGTFLVGINEIIDPIMWVVTAFAAIYFEWDNIVKVYHYLAEELGKFTDNVKKFFGFGTSEQKISNDKKIEPIIKTETNVDKIIQSNKVQNNHTFEFQFKGLHGSDVKVIQKNANNKPLNVKMGFSDSGIA